MRQDETGLVDSQDNLTLRSVRRRERFPRSKDASESRGASDGTVGATREETEEDESLTPRPTQTLRVRTTTETRYVSDEGKGERPYEQRVSLCLGGTSRGSTETSVWWRGVIVYSLPRGQIEYKERDVRKRGLCLEVGCTRIK